MKRLQFLFILASIALITVPQIGFAQTVTAEEPLQAEAQVEAERSNQTQDKLMPAEIRRGKTRLRVCLLYTSPSPRDRTRSRMPSSA